MNQPSFKLKGDRPIKTWSVTLCLRFAYLVTAEGGGEEVREGAPTQTQGGESV